MLSTFNLPSNNIDPSRQMAMMRTYLSQLKDELESELYNIGWNNLSKELREKISSLESYKGDNDEKVNMIRANMVTTDYLTANYITAGQISAAYASIGSLNALSGEFNSLKSIAITSNNISTITLDASQITSGTISANRISSAIMRTSSFTAAAVSALFTQSAQSYLDYVRIGQLVMSDEGANRVFSPMTVIDSNGTHRVLGWK